MHVPGAETALQHLLDRARHPHTHTAAEIVGEPGSGAGVLGIACLSKQTQMQVHNRDVFRPQIRHRTGDKIDDRLNAFLAQRLIADEGQHDTGLGFFTIVREGFLARQHEVYPGA